MRLFVKLLLALAACVAVAAVAVHFLVPPDLVRDRVAAAIHEQTGRTLEIAGDASLSIWPSLGVDLSDVTLSDPPDMGDGATLRMESLKLALAPLPLFARQVVVDSFVLVRPTITLRRDKSGLTNWRFDRPKNDKRAQRLERRRAQADGAQRVRALTLSDVRIEDGAVDWVDERSGAHRTAEDVNVTLSLPSLDDPLDMGGSFRWKGEMVDLDVQVEKPQALRAGAPSPLSVALKAPSLNVAFKGRLDPARPARFEGDLSAKSPSVRAVLDWLGDGAPTKEGFGAASIDGKLSGQGGDYALKQARISFDGMNGQGQAVLSTKPERPHLRAALALDRLLVDPYLSGPPPKRHAVLHRKRRVVAAQAAPDDDLTGFIDRLGDDPAADEFAPEPDAAPPAEAAPAPEPAPAETAAPPVARAAGLRGLDADVNLNVANIAVKRIRIGKSVVAATLRDGVLDANLKETALYGGAGKGSLRYDARPVPADLKADLTLNDVSALPLLQDAAQFAWISGKAQVHLSLAGRGQNGEALTKSLTGQGNIRFTDGAIEGFNIPQMVRALKEGRTDWRTQENLRTDFSELAGSFTMQDGVATTNDVNLASPLLRVMASGTVDLPRRWLDLEAKPTIVANLEGQGSEAEQTGIVVPFDIEGPWDRPSFKPDLKRLLDDPDAAAQTLDSLRQQLKGIKGRDVGRILDGLLGGGRDAQGEPPPDGEVSPDGEPPAEGEDGAQTERVKPRDLLKQFLR